MKRYYNNNNLELDPIRATWNKNNELLEFHKPINKLRDDIMINNLAINKLNKPLQQQIRPKKDIFETFENNYQGKNNYYSGRPSKKYVKIRNFDAFCIQFLLKLCSNHIKLT